MVIIDASLKSKSPSDAPRLSAATWVDRVLPIIQASSTEGRQIAQVRSSGSTMSPSAIRSELNAAAGAAQRTYQQVTVLHPPTALTAAAGLLDACLVLRSQAASEMAKAVSGELSQAAAARSSGSGSGSLGSGSLGSGAAASSSAGASGGSVLGNAGSGSGGGGASSDPQVKAIGTAGQDFQIADRAYALFAQRLPSVGVTAPASTWVNDANQYSASSLQTYVSTLGDGGSGSTSSGQQIAIPAVTLNPGPLNVQNGVEVLVATNAVSISAVVQNTGTQTEGNLSVIASINPSAGNAVFKQVISLPPGAAYNTPLGPLNPKPGAVTTLTIQVVSLAGASLASSTVTFMTA